jgi:hypothetical protein
MDAKVFNTKFMEWVKASLSSMGQNFHHISIDGKTLRGTKTNIHLVSAVASELGLCLGQVKTDEKSNEITAIPELLDLLEVKGCIVSIDAMGIQKEIATKITKKEGDYFLALKGNQKGLYEQVMDEFEREKADEYYQTQDYSGSHN